MKTLTALGGGLAGACAVSLVHETVRRVVPEAPRMDRLGMQAISKGLHKAGMKSPSSSALFTWALVGDLVTNALYYSMAGIGNEKNAWRKAAALGLAAGVGAVLLPKPLGLNPEHSNKTTTTKLLTIGLYVAGALITTGVMKMMSRRKMKRQNVWEQRLVTSAMG